MFERDSGPDRNRSCGPRRLNPSLFLVVSLLCGACGGETPVEPTPFPEIPRNVVLLPEDGAIYAVNLDDPEERTMLVRGGDPTVTSDGTLIYVDSLGLAEYEPGSTKPRRIVRIMEAPENTDPWNEALRRPRVSRDGTLIAYCNESGDVFVVDRQTGDLQAEFQSKNSTEGFATPSWAEGNYLVMAGNKHGQGIFVSPPPYDSTYVIATEYYFAQALDVHPDGRSIIFRNFSGLAEIDLDGNNDHLVMTGSQRNGPVWLPDGERLFFIYSENTYSGDSAAIRNVESNESFPFDWMDIQFRAEPWGWEPSIAFR